MWFSCIFSRCRRCRCHYRCCSLSPRRVVLVKLQILFVNCRPSLKSSLPPPPPPTLHTHRHARTQQLTHSNAEESPHSRLNSAPPSPPLPTTKTAASFAAAAAAAQYLCILKVSRVQQQQQQLHQQCTIRLEKFHVKFKCSTFSSFHWLFLYYMCFVCASASAAVAAALCIVF